MSQRRDLLRAAQRVLFGAQPAAPPPERTVQNFVFDLGEDREGVTLVKKSEEGYLCRMRYLRGGTPQMEDSRKFKMDPEDLAAVMKHARERMAKKFIPQIYEHGWSMYGGMACGKWKDVDDAGGDFWAVVLLDEEGYKGAVSPGLNWFSRSCGFQAWIDEDEFIRPISPFEGSFTNFPAMVGLGGVEEMSAARELFTKRAAGTLFVPAALANRPNDDPATTTKPDAGARSDVDPKKPSPVAASLGKEQEMLSKEYLSSLGLPENASAADVEKKLKERDEARDKEIVALKAKAPEKPEPPKADPAKPTLPEEMKALMREGVKDLLKETTDQLREEFATKQREDQIKVALDAAEKEGRITAAERPDFLEIGQKVSFDAMKRRLDAQKVKAPTQSIFEALNPQASAPAATEGSTTLSRTDFLNEARNLAEELGTDLSTATAVLRQNGVAVN